MALTIEWRKRIDWWMKVLPEMLYTPLVELQLEGFVSDLAYNVKQAQKAEFIPMPVGTKWGGKWQYAWFRSRFTISREMNGKRVVALIKTGGEAVAYINGSAVGGIDGPHPYTHISKRARAGDVLDIMIEAYAGHGPRPCHAGPVPAGVETVPEPAAKQCTMGDCSIGIWNEEAYQLLMDVRTLLSLRDGLAADELRTAEIDEALRDFTVLCDLEEEGVALLRGLRAARKRLQPLLECRNGSTAPRFYCVGHSHLDVAWLWPLDETRRKIDRTWSTQLALMELYPEYRFLQSQPHLFWMCKKYYPELYRKVKRRVKQGRFIPEGGMWVEADTNITGGESLIRQFLYGKKFFREEFGLDNRMLWLPDVFGYSGALPQIMKGCGVDYFATSKIFWNYNGGEPFPYNSFFWEGIDGTRILAHLYNDYNSHTDPRVFINRWNTRVQKDGIRERLIPFGHGDGGGGPQRDHLEYLRREENLEGMPCCRITHPVEFFEELEKSAGCLPVYVGELYFQCHRGTYTTQARTKRGNRRCEYALREAEMWSAAATWLAGFEYPAKRMETAWREVLLNQFHDIIPGSSIAKVYAEAEAGYAAVLDAAGRTASAAAGKLMRSKKDAVSVFNSLSWERQALVPLPSGFSGAVTEAGEPVATQRIANVLFAEVPSVPSCGWTTLLAAAPAKTESTLCVTSHQLENEYLRIRFNQKGCVESIFDKESQRELAAGLCNDFRMYKDVPGLFDAWDIDSTYAAAPVELNETAETRIRARGPLLVSLEIKRRLNKSSLIQVVSLRRGSRRIDFATTVDWQEKHKLLKVNFPVNIHSDEAIHEIQFGHISRPTHMSRQFDADRFEVSAHKWTALSEQNRGCAVLNDCKYGVNVEHGSINLTLLKSSLAPDMRADLGRQEFTYSFYAWNGSFAESALIAEAYDLNVPALVLPGSGGTRSLFSVDKPNVVIEAVKPAEDGSGDIILRLYESKRMATYCSLETSMEGVVSVREADMLEQPAKTAGRGRQRWKLSFAPFEIKTLRISKRKKRLVRERGLICANTLS